MKDRKKGSKEKGLELLLVMSWLIEWWGMVVFAATS